MAIIQAKRDTRLKLRNADSKHLKPTEYFEVKAGSNLGCDILSVEGKTAKIRLAGNAGLLKAGEEWYLFAPDWDLGKDTIVSFSTAKQSKKNGVLLQTPYFPQNDNEYWDGNAGNVQCCPTANAMLAAYLDKDMIARSKANGFVEPESYYKAKFEACGYTAKDRGNHDAHTVTLEKHFGIRSRWSMTVSSKQIIEQLDQGYPVVAGFQYKTAGHVCTIVGYYLDEGGGLLIHDPYGNRNGASDSYAYINPGYGDQSGKADRYSWGILNRILFDGNNQGGWARLVLSVK